MLGDGINDSTALATATVGAAMGETSAALAANSADVVLMTDKLQRLTQCIRLCRYAFCIEQDSTLPSMSRESHRGRLCFVGPLAIVMAIVADLELWCWSWCLTLSLSRRFWTEKDSQEYSDSWPILNLVITDEMIDIELKQLKFHVVRLCSIYPDPSGLHVLMLVYFSIFCFQRPSCFAKAIESETGSSETESSSQTLQNELSV